MSADGMVLAYTGDTGPSDDLVDLARDADVFLAEATYAEELPARFAGNLSPGRMAGEVAARAGAGQLLMTHLWPGLAPELVAAAARESYPGPLAVATTGLTIHIG